MKCYICENELILTEENKYIEILGICNVYKCEKCGEILYFPIRFEEFKPIDELMRGKKNGCYLVEKGRRLK